MSDDVMRGAAFGVQLPLTQKSDGQPVSDLGTAVRVRCLLIEKRDGTPHGPFSSDDAEPRVTIDDPATGTVTLALKTTDTLLDEGLYDILVQVEYPPDGENNAPALFEDAFRILGNDLAPSS